ncbi:MAG: hypothetical protein IIC99_00665 [Chloroflexi bacterium]|nr:hypothetical protein [Chloroflexota bacterium]
MREGHGERTNRATGNVSNRLLGLSLGPSRVLTFPLQALVCGILLPLVAVESVCTLIFRRSAPALDRFVRGVTGFRPQMPRRIAVAPFRRSGDRLPGLPSTGKSSPKAVKPAAFVRPGRIAVSIIARLARAVDHRVRKITLTISIEGAVVRVVVFRGRRVLSWRSAWVGDEFGPLAGSGSDHAGEFGDQVTPSLLKRVLQGVERGHRRVVFDLPAYTCLIRNLTLTKVGRRYLGPIVETELLESLPFGKSQVDLSWCTRPSPGFKKGRLEVFALAVPRAEMERTAGLLADSGVSPSAAYARSTTLAYAVGAANSLIIHFENDTAAIVPILNGEPRVVHQVACPRDGSRSEADYDALARGVEQVEAFSSGRPGLEDPGDDETDYPLAPVVLTGDVFGAGVDPRELEKVLQRPVSTLRTSEDRPLDHPPNFPVAQYASNIGLFLADRAGVGSWQSAFRKQASRNKASRKGASGMVLRNAPPGLNVLPQRHLPPPLPPLLAPIFIALLLAAAGTVPVWEKTNTVVDGADALEVRLDFLQGQAKQRRSMVDRELELTGNLQATTDEAAALESRLDETQRDMQTLLAQLKAITYDTESHGVSLYGLNPEQNGFAISGTAETHGDVLNYAQAVRDSGHFGDARITGLEGLGKEAGGRITFRILATNPLPRHNAEGQASSTGAPDTSATTP